MGLYFISPDWPAPDNVRALTTTRGGGISLAPYDSLNLGDHVGDVAAAVQENRRRLCSELSLPAEPRWLRQVHGVSCCDISSVDSGTEADAVFSRRSDEVCAVLTADCLPVLLCNRDGTAVAAIHAGWRGLLHGVIENSVASMVEGGDLLAWLGPAIGPEAFEVGDEVRCAFIEHSPDAAGAFTSKENGKWLADIYQLARQRLSACGVEQVYGGGLCTFSEPHRFYSYRRDGQTGRMASLIWMEK